MKTTQLAVKKFRGLFENQCSIRVALLYDPCLWRGEWIKRMLDTSIEKLCIEKGMKMTEQRRVIARVLSLAEDHPDVEELHRRAAELDPRISIATVYRTVRLWEEANILERHDFGDGRSRYEEVTDDHHDHLIDMKSGRVVEFQNEEIEELQEKIAQAHGMKLVGHRLELYGIPVKDGE